VTGSDDGVYGMSEVDELDFRAGDEVTRVEADEAAGAAVARFVTEMRALGEGPAPVPSPELAAILGGASSHRLLSRRRPARRAQRSRRVLAYATAAAVMVGTAGVAAANDTLPQPAQRVVSRVVNMLTPLHIDPSRPAKPVEPPRPSPIRTAPAVPPQVDDSESRSDAAPEPSDGAPDGELPQQTEAGDGSGAAENSSDGGGGEPGD
jgi:hypothetical protein